MELIIFFRKENNQNALDYRLFFAMKFLAERKKTINFSQLELLKVANVSKPFFLRYYKNINAFLDAINTKF
ncbi:hypothetical protein NRIC_25440 [Enterococcus florum]|uniref:Uncharacterized protein n=1 Tax=Enterococcus florum TaxID=2480627 RepID=A0A4P5PN93_9ENTE|nr:hypothetical protein [Enterococcus florum]GCF94653.1 hypothetical protein NRIC_25440 [Enterococcus florum]